MKFKMSERSLFATLLRAPWWVSFVVMAVVALLAGALLPEAYKIPGMLGAFPFLVIGLIAAWRQRHALSPQQIDTFTELARRMAWADFSGVIAQALRRQGFEVRALAHGPADWEIEKQGRCVLVSARRWKAATIGAEHLRALLDAREPAQAAACSCMTLGQYSPAALALAQAHDIQLLGPTDIAQLMREGGP